MMISPAKVLFYFIEFINCYASIYYSNFLFFYLRRTFGFGEAENLLTAALGGFVYIIAAWQGGKWAERYGCVRMLYLGCLRRHFVPGPGRGIHYPGGAGHGVLFVDSGDFFYLAGP